jgi:hypothetical protein
MRYVVDLRHSLQAPCGVGSFNESTVFAYCFEDRSRRHFHRAALHCKVGPAKELLTRRVYRYEHLLLTILQREYHIHIRTSSI